MEIVLTVREYAQLLANVGDGSQGAFELGMRLALAKAEEQRATREMRASMTQEIQQDMLSPLSRKPKPKRKRRPELSRGWREANMRLRTKSGNLRKGKTQADVAKLAHKLAKKYKK